MNNQTSNLITDLGLDGLPEDEKNEMIVKLSESLQNRITLRLTDTLSDEQKKEMDKLITQGDDDKVGEYLVKSVPGIDFIMKDEYEKFRDEILSENQEIKGRIEEFQKKQKS
ncbi:MAG: DUF5663 domain-containing protein [bacterium]|nr:DUF5663 domain-containing protein [bacterium]